MSDDLRSNSLETYWMPFTPNREFKADPRMVVGAKGMHYIASDGHKVLDGTSGLWCSNAGHGRDEIIQAIQKQAVELDFISNFNMGHPLAFKFADRIAGLMPKGLNRIFFTNSGSESADTALKIALAYQRARGKATKTRLIGRERGYHGVGFGGISVGGMVKNRMYFGSLLAGVDHLPHTHDLAKNAFSRGEPEHGADLADALERLVALHDASTIAAVIVEPVPGSTGVLPPPKGYLKRLRALCDKHDILLIFDEVITGFGRTGKPFAAETFDVTPDILTMAKALTNAAVPMGAVAVRQDIHDAMMANADGPTELYHGYTYSGHPLACAAGLATFDIYKNEGLFERAGDLSHYFEDAVHSLRDAPHVIDIRNMGLMAGIELQPRPAGHGSGQLYRGAELFRYCFDDGVLIRAPGDIIALSPPLIVEKSQIDQIVDSIRKGLSKVA